jgi:5-methylthioribose kinase
VESQFYQAIQNIPESQQYVPELLALDPFNRIIGIEDLGEGTDFTFLYQKGKSLSQDQLNHLLSFLDLLHGKIDTDIIASYQDNLKLRRLNHEHLFIYPFHTENGFDLNTVTPGLQEVSLSYKTDSALKKKLNTLGEIYLSTGDTLLHGDYYPGSWLNTRDGIKIIDPEFSYVGKKEFDLGILMAHLKMSQAEDLQIENLIKHFNTKEIEWTLVYQFAGVEILRRIIGLAQLSLYLTLTEKAALLKEAADMVKK